MVSVMGDKARSPTCQAGITVNRMKQPPSPRRQIGFTTNHDKRLTHANDSLPLVLKTSHFRNIRVNDGLSSYRERS